MNRISSARMLALAVCAALAALVQFSCDENPAGNKDLKLRIVAHSGNGQSERTGVTLPEPLVAKVSDILGNPKSGIVVSFATSDAGASVTPPSAVTGSDGLASCAFRLGTSAGTQHVLAAMEDDSTLFSETAVAPACSEENPVKLCTWPSAHLFIATTSSSELSGTGTAVIDYNPATKNVTTVLVTTDLLDGISFSSRGELFVSSPGKIRKVDHDLLALQDYVTWSDDVSNVSLAPNEGSVLVGCTLMGPLRIGCAGGGIEYLLPAHSFADNVKWQNLAADPVTRDVYFISEFAPTNYALWRVFWDGRSSVRSFDVAANLSVGAAVPAGMCIDSTGTVYIVFDGNDNYRRIVTVSSTGAVDYDFFNFYTYYEMNSEQAGRWGSIAYLAGKLYVIDQRNDRLVIVSKGGQWLDEVKSTTFSAPFFDGGRYAICASEPRICPGK